MTAPLNPADNRVGRYTGPARIVFQGDQSICARYVTLGRNVLGSLRHSLALGGINEGMRGASVNGVSILAMHKGGMDQIFINATQAGGKADYIPEPGYQFAVTGLPDRVVLSVGGFRRTLSSFVFVPWPRPTYLSWNEVKPIPTGSMLISDQKDPDKPRWPLFEVNNDQQFAFAGNRIAKYNIGIQVDGMPANHACRYISKSYKTPPYQVSRPIYYSGASCEGQIRNAGALMIAPGFMTGDVAYDRAPTGIGMDAFSATFEASEKTWTRSQKGYQAPDADWYHDATIVKVPLPGTEQTVNFVVMVDASSTFWAWPVAATEAHFLKQDSPYFNQSIKTNIKQDRARFCKPPFPSWVYDTTDISYRKYYATYGRPPPEPRYVWKFHPFERKPLPNKVVGMCVQRDKPSYPVLKKLVGSGFRLNDLFETDGDMTPASLYWKRKFGSQYEEDIDLREIEEDIPGFAEFTFGINITSELPFDADTCEFDFSMELLRNEVASEYSYPIAASYLNPVEGGWMERGVKANAGDLLVAKLRFFEHPNYMIDLLSLMQGKASFIQHQLSRVYMDIVNIDKDSEVIKTIPLIINDDCYGQSLVDHEGTEVSAKTNTVILGKIMQLELAEFSWLVRYENTKISAIEETLFNVKPYNIDHLPLSVYDETIYSNRALDPENPVSYPLDDDGIIFGAESEIALRFIHRNKNIFKGMKPDDASYGVNLGTFNLVDNAVEYGTPLLLEKQRLYLYGNKENALDDSTNSGLLYLAVTAFFYCESYLHETDLTPGSAAILALMESQGYVGNITNNFPELPGDWFTWFSEVANEAEDLDPRNISTTLLALLDRKISRKSIPNDFNTFLPGYKDDLPAAKKHRIQAFNHGKNTMMRVWNSVVHESYRQYFKTGPDGFYAIAWTFPYINSRESFTNPFTGEIYALPEPPKPFPVGVGFHRWGWTNSRMIGTPLTTMSEYSVLYPFLAEIEKIEPDFANPNVPMTERTITLAVIDEIGFEDQALPKTSHAELFKRAYDLDDNEVYRPEHYIEVVWRPRFYVRGLPILAMDIQSYTKDKTLSGAELDYRYWESTPPSILNIPGLMLYSDNATEIDAPRYNASMQLVGQSVTGWRKQ